MIRKFVVSRDDSIYQAWPDVALTNSGKMVCVFSECTHHCDRSYTRIMLADSLDRGRTWSPKRPLTKATGKGEPFWNCARISRLPDGRLAVVVDLIEGAEDRRDDEKLRNFLFFSSDDGLTWSAPILTPARGIVPDKLQVLSGGRWLLPCQYKDHVLGNLVQRLWYSDDQGVTWNGPVIVARKQGLNLCEVSVLEVEPGTLVAFHRENSGQGLDCFKTISRDQGETWGEPIRFPLPACHRPVAGFLRDGRILITYRFMQGGKAWTQNLFAAITDKASALAADRAGAWARILPVDYDRSPQSDIGYSGWVQFEDDEIYIVNYLIDDAPKAQIRGYAVRPEDFLLAPLPARKEGGNR